jgi:hypothetical protein
MAYVSYPIPANLTFKKIVPTNMRLCPECLLEQVTWGVECNSEPFLYTSDKQLGAVTTQDEKPIACYSRKLNSAQQRYTTSEQELLLIVETLHEFRNFLLGYKIIVHTDHTKLKYAKSTLDREMRWRLLMTGLCRTRPPQIWPNVS